MLKAVQVVQLTSGFTLAQNVEQCVECLKSLLATKYMLCEMLAVDLFFVQLKTEESF